jgi:hypothetical protein
MDVVVVNAIRSVISVLAMMAAWKTALLARTYLAVKLFKTNTAIGPTTALGALSEADYSGYAPLVVASLNGPAIDSASIAYLTTPELFFTHNAGPVGNQIYSAGLVGTIAGGVQATGTVGVTGGVVDTPAVTLGGSGYLSSPQVTVSGAPGVGAIVTATVVAGVVTAITVVAGGTGYVAPTLVIEPPVELIAGSMLLSPRPMNISTDALPVVLQQNLPAGV